MKADRLSRKTHLKRHAALPASEGVRVFDLTAADDAPTADTEKPLIDLTADTPVLRPLSNLTIARPGDLDFINSLPARFETEDDLFDWCIAVLAESPTSK